MGFFEWLKGLFFGGAPAPKPMASPRPLLPKPLPPKPLPPKESDLPESKPAAPPLPKASYEAEEFLPISRKELKKGAATDEVRTSPWWGRIETIPPAGDARTQLIDRALVTRGYLTPAQLVEIHRVGDLMLQYKGDESLVRQILWPFVSIVSDQDSIDSPERFSCQQLRAQFSYSHYFISCSPHVQYSD